MPKHPVLSFDEFSTQARAMTEALPKEFLEGIESVDVHREKKPDSVLQDVLLLGECAVSPLSELVQEQAFRSTVHLYYGSFLEMAKLDPGFDMQGELRETIEHEIQHHIEDRAGVRTLLHEDALFEAHARFKAGLEVAPGWYRMGEQLGPRVWAVDLDLFVELRMRRREFEARRGSTFTFQLLDEPLEVELPADASPDEIFTVPEAGLVEGGPDEEEDEEDPDDDAPRTAGDLHLVPLVR